MGDDFQRRKVIKILGAGVVGGLAGCTSGGGGDSSDGSDGDGGGSGSGGDGGSDSMSDGGENGDQNSNNANWQSVPGEVVVKVSDKNKKIEIVSHSGQKNEERSDFQVTMTVKRTKKISGTKGNTLKLNVYDSGGNKVGNTIIRKSRSRLEVGATKEIKQSLSITMLNINQETGKRYKFSDIEKYKIVVDSKFPS